MSGAAVVPNSAIPNREMIHILTAEFLTPAQVAALLRMSRKELAEWRRKRQGPLFRLGRRGVVIYPAEGLKNFLRARAQEGSREVRWSRAAVSRNHAASLNH
jgi:hypothetical protein